MLKEVCDWCGCDIGKLYCCDGTMLCYDCMMDWDEEAREEYYDDDE
jgi:hypothetical protein